MMFKRAIMLSVFGVFVLGASAHAQLIFEPSESEEKQVVSDDALPWLKKAPVAPKKEEQPVRKKVEVKKIEDHSADMLAVVNFPLRYVELQRSHKDVIDLKLKGVRNKSSVRIQLKSFATAKVGHAGEERRIALRRGLSARKYLEELGFNKRNVYIQALGKEGVGDGVKDRIEVMQLN